jgi:hypothetical protein
MNAFVDVKIFEFIERHPAEFSRFVITHGNRSFGRKNNKANVEVEMWRLARWPNFVDIEVEGRSYNTQSVNARLFNRLSKCRCSEVCVAIDMATWLQPLLQFRVKEQNESFGAFFDDECGTGEMSLSTRAKKRIVVHATELDHSSR